MLAMKKGMLTLVLFFASTFFVGSCDDNVGDIYICPRKCPSTAPWTIDYLEVPYPCYETKAVCVEAALKAGFTADRCVTCDY